MFLFLLKYKVKRKVQKNGTLTLTALIHPLYGRLQLLRLTSPLTLPLSAAVYIKGRQAGSKGTRLGFRVMLTCYSTHDLGVWGRLPPKHSNTIVITQGSDIGMVDSFKYQQVHIDNKLLWSSHIQEGTALYCGDSGTPWSAGLSSLPQQCATSLCSWEVELRTGTRGTWTYF